MCNHELEDIKKYLDDKVCSSAANCHYWAFIGSRDCVKIVGQTCLFVLIFTSHINFFSSAAATFAGLHVSLFLAQGM